MSGRIFYDPGHSAYEGISFERPERVAAVADSLRQNGYSFESVSPAGESDLLRVHTKHYLEGLRTGDFLHTEWAPPLPEIYEQARLAAGGALQAAAAALDGAVSFSLMRPPGHHAGRQKADGFCYINNIAVAAASLRERGMKVGILDFDIHHGDGTEEIFFGEPRVFYASLHTAGAWPGTGRMHGMNRRNYPLAKGIADARYLAAFDEALGHVRQFGPDVVAVSAGFDAYEEDPTREDGEPCISLSADVYPQIGDRIRNLGKPTFAVLEGGYNVAKMPGLVDGFLRALAR